MGHQHPMNRVLQEVKEIFIGMGYQIVDGPEIEEAAYNFTKLNIEEGHPSRDRSDTFYFDDDDSVLLRTQTSPMQIRVMEQQKPPIRMLAACSARMRPTPRTPRCSIRSKASSSTRASRWAT